MNDFIQYILHLFQRGIYFAVPAILLCVLVLAAAWGIARKKGQPFPWRRAVALLLLISWLGLTLFVTLFRGEPGFRQWNFHLFLAWREAWNQFALRAWLNVLLNIALFVPLGMLLPLLSRMFQTWYVMLLAGFGSSLAIELGQLVTARGMFDVDDLFTNTLGAMVGWSVVMLLWTLLERKTGWKPHCLAYLSVPAALALVLVGIFVGYAVKPYGNLQDAPAVTANLKNVQWKLEFTPEDEPVTLPQAPHTAESEAPPVPMPAQAPPVHKVIGEAFDTYIILQYDSETLMFIDKHAAHERLLYEQLKSRRREAAAQTLLLPVTVTLDKAEYTAVLSNLQIFADAGFDVEDFGSGTVLVRTAPLNLDGADIEGSVLEMAGYLEQNRSDVTTEHMDWLYHNIACRAAIKGGSASRREELIALAERLEQNPEVRYCPHGRPIYVMLKKKMLEKEFGRLG